MVYILHLSDLHIVEQSSWNNMKTLLFKTIRKKFHHLPDGQKLIVITGDFHNFYENNYDTANMFISKLVQEAGVDLNKDVFGVPGNHDQKLSSKSSFKTAQSNTIKAIYNDITDIENEGNLEWLLEAFELYNSFMRQLGIYSDTDPMPGDAHVRTWRDKLNVVHTNTALIADGKHKTDQVVDIKKITADSTRKSLENGLPTIALGHNSFYDLHESIQNKLTAFFSQEQIKAYLAGDQHRFNRVRNEQYIYLHTDFSSETIPNIICGKGAADEKDDYSDFGFIIHNWNEKTGNVSIERFHYDLEKDQDRFDSEKINNVYNLSIKTTDDQDVNTSDTMVNSQYGSMLDNYKKYIASQCMLM